MKFAGIGLLLLCLGWQSCCIKNETENHRLSDYQRTLIGYTDQQQLVFRDTIGNEFTVTASKKNTTRNFTFNECAECCKTKENDEIDFFSFTTSNTDFFFPSIVIIPETSKSQNPRTLAFLMNASVDGVRLNSGGAYAEQIMTNANTLSGFFPDFIIYYDNGDMPCNESSFSFCRTEIEINGEIYKDVFELNWGYYYIVSDDKNYEVKILYNRTHGFLRYQRTVTRNYAVVDYDEYYLVK